MTKETKDYWDEASEDYQRECNIPIKIHYGPGAPFEDELNLLGNLRGKNVLEIGCGGAQCSIAMARQGAKVTGIDISERQLQFARTLAEKNGVIIKLYQGNIESFPQIRSNSQDLVFSAWALFYVDNLESCFRETYRVLKKGGYFVASSIHPFFRIVDEKTLKIRESYFDVGKRTYSEVWKDGTKHYLEVYNRTVSDITNLLMDIGFSIERILEPDSRRNYPENPWYNKFGCNPKIMSYVPPTIIFKAKKHLIKNDK